MIKYLIIYIILILMLTFSVNAISGFDQSGLVTYYSLDNVDISGGTIIDRSPNGYNGTNVNTVFGVLGYINEGAHHQNFQYYLTNQLNGTFNTLEYSVSFWFKTNQTVINAFMEKRTLGANGARQLHLTINSGDIGAVRFQAYNGTPTSQVDIRSNITIDTYNDNVWHHVVVQRNFSEARIYVDNILHQIDTDVHESVQGNVDQHLQIGRARKDTGANRWTYDGHMDELVFFDRMINETEIELLYNDTLGFLFDDSIKNLNMLFDNQSVFNVDQVNFDLDEEIYYFLNWSEQTDSSPVLGQCDITQYNGYTPIHANDENFTICNSGCNYTSYSEEFQQDSTLNVLNDLIHLTVCHPGPIVRDLIVNQSCSSGSEQFTIPSNQIVSCSITDSQYFINFTNCITDLNSTITVTSPDSINFSQSNRVLELEFSRFYSVHPLLFNDDVFYNSTTGFYYTNHAHEYHDQGQKFVTGNCSNSTEGISTFVNESITIQNFVPQIFFDLISYPCGTNLFNDTVEFCSGDWSFNVPVIDTDIDTINVELNCSGSNIYSQSFNINNYNITLNSGNFVDFDDPLNINRTCNLWVQVNDTQSVTVNDQQQFTVVDIQTPICTGFTNSTQTINTTYNWNVNCLDEHMFSFNLTCDNGFTFYKDQINSTSYNFVNSTNVTQNITCQFEYCDGHTKDKLDKSFKATKLDKKLKFTFKNKDLNFNYTGNKDINLDFVKHYDRYSFIFTNNEQNDKDKIKNYKFTYYAPDSVYIPSNMFQGWIISKSTKTWFDLENDANAIIDIKPRGKDTYEITVTTKSNNVIFNSIGELNCITGEQELIALEPTEPAATAFETNVCPTSISFSLIFISLIFLSLFLIIFGYILNIGILNIFGCLILLILSWTLFGCSTMIGVIIGLFSIVLLLHSILSIRLS